MRLVGQLLDSLGDMRLEDQVCSLELAKRLKELGVKQESNFWWAISKDRPGDGWFFCHPIHWKHHAHLYEGISAFTVAELGEILSKRWNPISSALDGLPIFNGEWCWYDEGILRVKEKTEADARAKMICHLIEQGLMKPC